MCAEKMTCACHHDTAAEKHQPLAETDELGCPMNRGENPPPPGPETNCDKLERETE